MGSEMCIRDRPRETDFFVEGMGGVFVCSDGKLHTNQTRLGEMLS